MPPPSEIHVYVVDFGRTYLQMRYTDPTTGKTVMRSTRETTRKAAERVAAVWESELRSGVWKPDGRMSWAMFKTEYHHKHLMSLRESAERRTLSILNQFERWMSPATIAAVSAAMISNYQAKMRDAKRSEATIVTHTGALRAALQWAVDLGYLRELPRLRQVARANRGRKSGKPMKGRPLSDVEFAAMLKAVAEVVGPDIAPAWERYLRGLWLSGLRLEESLVLSWDDPTNLTVDLGGRRPVLRIAGAAEKAGQDRILPIAPEFAEFLAETPETDRTGLVFKLPKRKKRNRPFTVLAVGKIVSAIGAASGIIVDQKTGKTASAHDLRRSFGSRWATRVMPQVLMELMRHADISTTLRYYVGLNAERTADVLWGVHNAEKAASVVVDLGCAPGCTDEPEDAKHPET